MRRIRIAQHGDGGEMGSPNIFADRRNFKWYAAIGDWHNTMVSGRKNVDCNVLYTLYRSAIYTLIANNSQACLRVTPGLNHDTGPRTNP